MAYLLYLQHAAVVVAPLRLARGIQNKVLEAMAMGRPVVASATCAEAIDGQVGSKLITATTPSDFVRGILWLLREPSFARTVGEAGRRCKLRSYSWDAHSAGTDRAIAEILRIGLAA